MLLFAFLQTIAGPVTISPANNVVVSGNSDNTTIWAVIEPICAVEAGSDTVVLNISTRGPQAVTTLNYVCNEVAGLTRTIVSENAGALRRNSQNIPYFVSQTGVGGLALQRTSLAAPSTSSVAGSYALTVGSTGTFEVEIPSLAANLLAGDYRDTITVTITPN